MKWEILSKPPWGTNPGSIKIFNQRRFFSKTAALSLLLSFGFNETRSRKKPAKVERYSAGKARTFATAAGIPFGISERELPSPSQREAPNNSLSSRTQNEANHPDERVRCLSRLSFWQVRSFLRNSEVASTLRRGAARRLPRTRCGKLVRKEIAEKKIIMFTSRRVSRLPR